MTCRELIDFLGDYLDGQLPAAQRGAFESHLGACPHCANYLDSYRKTIALAGEAFDGDAPAEHAAPDEIVRAVIEARKKSS
jgi:anti-sigma factor RsiW